MGQEEKERIIIPDENGDEHLFDELFKFTQEDTGKSYILLVPVGDLENDSETEEEEVYAFRYEDNGPEKDLSLYAIETDEEWDMIEEVLNTLEDEELLTEE